MYTGKIEPYTFELNTDTNHIYVYEKGKGVDPVKLIKVEEGITEKDFHYEIMDFVMRKQYN